MKLRNFYIIILILAIFSCKKTINLAPLDRLNDAGYFQNANDFQTFANQFYFTLPDLSAADDNSDISMATGFSQISNSSYSAPAGDVDWDGNYANLWQINYLLQKAAAYKGSDIAKYVAEAKFFRAFAHFNLMKKFGDVPIVTQALGVNSNDIVYGARNSRADVTTQIMNDLNAAITDLPDASADGRITKSAALALQARVALFEGTWRKYHGGGDPNPLLDIAITSSKTIMNNSAYKLFDRRDVLGDSSYRFSFLLEGKRTTNPAGLTKADNLETILAHRHDPDISPSATVNIGQSNLSPTRKLVDMFLCKDGLPTTQSPLFLGYSHITDEYQNRDPRMTQDLLYPFQKYWLFTQPAYYRDWTNPTHGGITFDIAFGILTQTGYSTHKMQQELGGPEGNDYPVFRLAEMYLIFAEATFERNGTISDGDLNLSINMLRNRVGMPALTNAFVGANGLDMLTEIRRERTIELFVEGFRFDDLRRWKTAETELSQDVRGIKYTGTEYASKAPWNTLVFTTDANGFIVLEPASKRQFAQKNYLFPIPLRQIILNPKLTQNPGW